MEPQNDLPRYIAINTVCSCYDKTRCSLLVLLPLSHYFLYFGNSFEVIYECVTHITLHIISLNFGHQAFSFQEGEGRNFQMNGILLG